MGKIYAEFNSTKQQNHKKGKLHAEVHLDVLFDILKVIKSAIHSCSSTPLNFLSLLNLNATQNLEVPS